MTSVSPYPEEVRLVQRRNSLNGKSSRPLSEYSDPYNNAPGLTNRRNSTNQHQHFAQDNLESYDNALPWNAKDSKNDKNFYETYSKENDRRKREGNQNEATLPNQKIELECLKSIFILKKFNR